MEKKICSICGKEFTEWGNNAYSVNNGNCCDECNSNVVIPARLERIIRKEND